MYQWYPCENLIGVSVKAVIKSSGLPRASFYLLVDWLIRPS